MKKLFGTDGIRGKIGTELNSIEAMKIAMAAGIFLRKKSVTGKILIGKDTRRSGYTIENAIVSGLTAIGYNVIQVGPMPTPAVAFLTSNMRCDGGIMISASHNEFCDNGIKFFNHDGNKFTVIEEEEIEQIYYDETKLNQAFEVDKFIGSSKRIDDVIGRYIVHLKNSFPKNLTMSGVRIVLDTANGAGYKIAPQIFEELGAEVLVIHDKPNGLNINEDCGALHYHQLAKEVVKLRANIGIALDGDADRLVVIDEQGEKIDGDNVMASIAVHLRDNDLLKNNAVVSTKLSNSALSEYLKSQQIDHFATDVGDRNVTMKMSEQGLNFGGEESGHIIFSDYASTGDGILTALQIIAIIISSKQEASTVLRKFAPYQVITKNLKVNDKKDLANIEELITFQQNLDKQKIKNIIRYSGTENVLRLLLESPLSRKELEIQMNDLLVLLEKHISFSY